MLTTVQRKVLLQYRGHREKPFTAVGLLMPLLPSAIFAGGLVALSYLVWPLPLTLFFAGLMAGVFLRNVALRLHALRVMPTLLQVIDWEKLDGLLEEPSRLV